MPRIAQLVRGSLGHRPETTAPSLYHTASAGLTTSLHTQEELRGKQLHRAQSLPCKRNRTLCLAGSAYKEGPPLPRKETCPEHEWKEGKLKGKESTLGDLAVISSSKGLS